MEQHPYIKAAIGSGCEWSEKRIVAPIRLGGVPRAYDRQLLILGDAAGYVDPLTGEGIHTAMISGQIAANTTIEMFSKHNYSIDACRAYSLRCYDAFGFEFVYSYLAAHVIYYIPISLDAIACIGMLEASTSIIIFIIIIIIIISIILIIIIVLLLIIIINMIIITTTIINIYNY